MTACKPLLILINPQSGTKIANKLFKKYLKPDLEQESVNYEVIRTEYAGHAKEIVRLAGEAGVKLTPAGSTFPYGVDPEDKNIRLSPTFPPLADLSAAMEVFVNCVQLATLRQHLNK